MSTQETFNPDAPMTMTSGTLIKAVMALAQTEKIANEAIEAIANDMEKLNPKK